MIGRGLRPAEGKSDIVILDHSGGVHRHGRPDDAIEWTLDHDQARINPAHEARVAEHRDPFCECTACGHLRMRGMACDNCGWEPKPYGRDVDYVDQDLVELSSTFNGPTQVDKMAFYAELRGYQKNAKKKDGSSYSQGWAAQQFKKKFGHYPPWDWNNRPTTQPTLATQRWIKSRIIAWAKAQERAT